MCADSVFCGEVFREQPMPFCFSTEKRQRSFIACGNGKSGIDKRLPVVCVIGDIDLPPYNGTSFL
jgi:hypothetical protein